VLELQVSEINHETTTKQLAGMLCLKQSTAGNLFGLLLRFTRIDEDTIAWIEDIVSAHHRLCNMLSSSAVKFHDIQK
jgi:hypothetical protein